MTDNDETLPDSGRNERADPPSPVADPPRTRDVLGPYRLLQRIGVGGMGEVWLAEQSEPISRRVAIKFIRSGMSTRQVIARFESERQALALMEHRSIARVYDAGTTAAGLPYFAMEYVRGEPITDYCDRVRATTRERIELLIEVCEAVQHAHQRAIIHRDLKPSNILVTEEGDRAVPKIIDFGVAKALGAKLSSNTLHTQLGQLVGTFEYMSPEQADASALGVDTRTDVYSLGVILYELLVGARPFEIEQEQRSDWVEAQRRLREVDPPRPSARVGTLGEASTDTARKRQTQVQSLARELRGDLDWITLKALEKDRARRYGSPSELAADLRRSLRHEPVEARPPSTAYRARKFVRRHRVGVAFAALLALSAVGLFAVTLVQNRRIAEQRDRANREAQAANAALDFMTELFEISDPSEARGNTITAREVLDRGADRIDGAFEGAPEAKARMMGTIGRVYESLGLYEPAARALETALVLEREAGRDPIALSTAISNIGWLDRERGDYASAEARFREELELRREHQGPRHPATASAINLLAITLADQGEHETAMELYRQALAIVDEQREPDAEQRVRLLNSIANGLAGLGRPAEAVPYYRQLLEHHVEENRGRDAVWVAFSHDNLALALHDLGLYEKAEGHYREALAMLERIFGPEHPEVAQTLGNVSSFLLDAGELEEAETLALRAVELTRGVLGEEHAMTADHLSTLGEILLEQERVEEAAAVAEEAMPIYRTTLPAGHAKILYGEAVLGAVRSAQGRLAEAEELLRSALDGLSTGSRASPRFLDRTREHLAALYERQGRPDEAAQVREHRGS
ncbi:MAG TPA: serine/threonine-protein kinase [Thermoanaerobaculia bacterium]|nr:serine/threonine-protein kinase [Thermoanaerobaculia bacterium]